MLEGNIFITGGAGTLGRAILRRAQKEGWDAKFTIFSTDPVKHARVTSQFPFVRSVIGDIRDPITVYNAMAGHDIVVHAAAVKEIPMGEWNSIDTYEINVRGSLNVANAAFQLKIPKVLAISTDKACHSANAYGATKYIMEKTWQEFARLESPTKFNLVRYGNVLESSASVLEKWKRAFEAGEKIQITDPEMTRFWLSPSQAVDYVVNALQTPSGYILVPGMPSLSIGKLAEYVLGEDISDRIERIPIRPGEKKHETLVTVEEMKNSPYFGESYTTHNGIKILGNSFMVPPSVSPSEKYLSTTPFFHDHFSSDIARELTKEELMELLSDE